MRRKKKVVKENRKEKAREELRRVFGLIVRYIMLVGGAIKNLYVFYWIFTPLTVYPIYFLLNLIYGAILDGKVIYSGGFSIEIVEACVAGSAFYFLFILNLSTRMPVKKRISGLVFSFCSFLFINLIRIFVFSILLINGFVYFDFVHMFFWYFLSTIFVLVVWFVEVKLFEIREIPVYSDMRFLYGLIRGT